MRLARVDGRPFFYTRTFGKHSTIVLECLFWACSSRLKWHKKKVLDMSRPVERGHDNARWCPGRHQLRQGYLELLQGKEIRKKLTKDCLQTKQMIFLAISFVLDWLLVAFGPFWALRSRFCWALAPCIRSAQGNTQKDGK